MHRDTISHPLNEQLSFADQLARLADELTRRNGWLKGLGIALVVFVAYAVGARTGIVFGFGATQIAVFWPPNIVLIVAMLFTPRHLWWIVLAAGLPAEYLAASFPGAPLYAAMLNYAGNAGQALLTVLLLDKFCDGLPRFDNFQSTAAFIGTAVIAAPAIGSLVFGVASVLIGWIDNLWLMWGARFLTDMLSALVLIPPALALMTLSKSQLRRTPLQRYLEGGGLLLGLTVTVALTIGGGLPELNFIPTLLYLPFPLFVWAAFRFGVTGVAVSLLTMTVVALENASAGRGVFSAGSPADNVFGLQVLIGVIGIPFMLLSALWTERRDNIRALQDGNEQIHRLASQLITAQEEERRCVARELHDEVGQALTTIKINLDMIRLMQDRPDVSAFAVSSTLLDESAARVDHALDQVRNLSLLLRPSILDDLGLVPALRWLASNQAERAGYRVMFTADALTPRPSSSIETLCYRVLQEALTNIARHAQASNVFICLKPANGQLRMTIRDDGVGFDVGEMRQRAAAGSSMGILGMEERALLCGGKLSIQSLPMHGTTLELSVPYAASIEPDDAAVQQALAQQQAAAAAAAAPPPAPAAGLTDEKIAQLQKLAELNKAGILTDEEFAAQKAKILAS